MRIFHSALLSQRTVRFTNQWLSGQAPQGMDSAGMSCPYLDGRQTEFFTDTFFEKKHGTVTSRA
jgi:hypothetical protein